MPARRPDPLARLAGVALLLTTPGCSPSITGGPTNATARADVPASAAAPPVVRVTAAKPTRATIRRVSEQPGQIEAVETTPIFAKLGGYVGRVAVDIGDPVKAGQILAELHVPEAEADLRQKHAEVKQAEAGRAQAEAAIEVAQAGVESAQARVGEIQFGIKRAEADVARWQAEFSRVDQLARERALTGSLLDETRSKLQAAEAGRDEVRAKVRSAEATLAEAKAMLDRARSDRDAAAAQIDVDRAEAERAQAMAAYARIVAPFDGTVTRRGIDTGHLTTPGAGGEPLFVVTRSGVVTISVGVPETEAARVDVGDRAQVRLQALEGKTFDGTVARTAWALDAPTRTLRVEIDLANPDRALRPGLYAYATIIAEERENALSVPAPAVVSDGGKTFCVTVADGHARRVEVKAGLSDGKRTEIVSGLGPDDLVVETNAATLADGEPVARNDPPADPAAAAPKK